MADTATAAEMREQLLNAYIQLMKDLSECESSNTRQYLLGELNGITLAVAFLLKSDLYEATLFLDLERRAQVTRAQLAV